MPDPQIDEGFFSARDGLRLFRQATRPPGTPAAHVAVLHGYAEHLGRHEEVTRALCTAGYAVHLFDCRGHGQSGGKRAHVDSFDEYLQDLDVFLARVREEAQGRPVFFLGHSHGALIGIRYLLDKPDAVRGAVFSSPYLRLKLRVSPLKILAGRLIANLFPSLPMRNELRPEQLTRDVAIQNATRNDPLCGPRVLRPRDQQGQAVQAVRRPAPRAVPRARARPGVPRPDRLARRARARRARARGHGARRVNERARLLELLTRLAYEKRKVVLSSGRESDFYIDTKQATLSAEGHYLVGRLALAEVRALVPDVQAVGGLTMGADPIASAVSLTSFLAGQPVPAFYVRKEPKGHGTNQWVEGRKGLPRGARVCVLEDVVTTGASTLKAVERCRSEELDVRGVVALVDREEGGRAAVEAAGVPLRSLFRRSDFP